MATASWVLLNPYTSKILFCQKLQFVCYNVQFSKPRSEGQLTSFEIGNQKKRRVIGLLSPLEISSMCFLVGVIIYPCIS